MGELADWAWLGVKAALLVAAFVWGLGICARLNHLLERVSFLEDMLARELAVEHLRGRVVKFRKES